MLPLNWRLMATYSPAIPWTPLCIAKGERKNEGFPSISCSNYYQIPKPWSNWDSGSVNNRSVQGYLLMRYIKNKFDEPTITDWPYKGHRHLGVAINNLIIIALAIFQQTLNGITRQTLPSLHKMQQFRQRIAQQMWSR